MRLNNKHIDLSKPRVMTIVNVTPDSFYDGSRTFTEEEIERCCAPLPRYKRPRRIIFAEVPRNPTGKIEKPKLRKIYCGESLVAQQVEVK